jgi:hypothetical protein
VKSRPTIIITTLVVLALLLLLLAMPRAAAQNARAQRTLKVRLNYTGAVDEKHRIYVLLFDSNPLTATTLADATSQRTPATPAPGVSHIIGSESVATKNGSITFHALPLSPVYAMFFLDKSGTYDGHVDPASGSPMGLYGEPPDKLQPIQVEAGKTAELTLTFDDSSLKP